MENKVNCDELQVIVSCFTNVYELEYNHINPLRTGVLYDNVYIDISSKYYTNFESQEYMFLRNYYIHSDVRNIFQSSTTLYCATCILRIKDYPF